MKKALRNFVLVLVLLLGVFAFTACGKKSSTKDDTPAIVGSWAHDEYVYTFNKDKTGSYKAYDIVLEFTYEDNGKSVKLLYEGNTIASEYEYKIDGKKLIIKDSFGDDVEYTKK